MPAAIRYAELDPQLARGRGRQNQFLRRARELEERTPRPRPVVQALHPLHGSSGPPVLGNGQGGHRNMPDGHARMLEAYPQDLQGVRQTDVYDVTGAAVGRVGGFPGEAPRRPPTSVRRPTGGHPVDEEMIAHRFGLEPEPGTDQSRMEILGLLWGDEQAVRRPEADGLEEARRRKMTPAAKSSSPATRSQRRAPDSDMSRTVNEAGGRSASRHHRPHDAERTSSTPSSTVWVGIGRRPFQSRSR